MNHLKDILYKIFQEASFETDEKSRLATQEFVRKIRSKVASKDGKLITKHDRPDHFITKIDGVNVKLFDKRSTDTHARVAYQKNIEGEYIHDNKELRIYKCDIEPKNGSLNIKFSVATVNHEFTHSQDFQRILKGKKGSKKDQAKLIKTVDPSDRSGYVSSPVEFNAHYLHTFTPFVEKYLDRKEKLPDWDTFIKAVLSDSDVSNFYKDLTKDYQKKFLKRTYTYYKGIHDVQDGKKPEIPSSFKDIPGGEDNLKVYKSKGFLDTIKSLFKKDK